MYSQNDVQTCRQAGGQIDRQTQTDDRQVDRQKNVQETVYRNKILRFSPSTGFDSAAFQGMSSILTLRYLNSDFS